MAKTNEEVVKILEKNFKEVQTLELNVYDKNVEVKKVFEKDGKAFDAELKKEIKGIAAETKSIESDNAKKVADTKAKEAALQKGLDDKLAKANEVYVQSIADIKAKYEAEGEKLNADLKKLEEEYNALTASVLKEYEKDVKASEKAVATINEKDEQDQKTFENKIDELNQKHEAKAQELTDKEKEKIEKLTEAANKQVEKLENDLKEQREKLDTKLAQLKPVYEEELEEIDENIQEKKEEYEAKHESIRSSADQRIAVREKHMHRAMDDNDQRSAKQHRKDIEKFRKDADKDLILLRKTFNQENEEALNYRKNFIKENFEKLAELDKEFANYQENKQQEIDNVKVTLVYDVENTKLDFEKQRSEELDSFNNSFADVRVKQEEVLKEKELALENELDKQNRSKIEFDKLNKLNDQQYKQDVESKDKELRDAVINKGKEDALAKDVLDVEVATLESEKDIASLELTKDLAVLAQALEKELHKQENKRLNAHKNEFYSYQSGLDPLFKNRAQEVFNYEEKELNNRYNIKIAFLETQLEELAKDKEAVLSKLSSVYETEKAPFEAIINEKAGSQKEELEVLEEEYNNKVTEMNQKIASLTDRKQKREKTQLEDELQELKRSYNQSKAAKESQITNAAKVYQDALNAATKRYEAAVEEANVLFSSEKERLLGTIDNLKNAQIAELDDAKMRLQATESEVQGFITKAASRNTVNTEENQAYLEAEIAYEQSLEDQAIKEYTEAKEARNNSYTATLKNLDEEKKELLQSVQDKLQKEESNLEEFKKNIADKKEEIKDEASKLLDNETDKTKHKQEEITSKYDDKQKAIKDDLEKKVSEHKQHLSEISKKVSQEEDKLDSEKKRVVKESDQRLKEELSSISKKLSEDTKNIE